MKRGIILITLLFYFITPGNSQNYTTRLFSKDQGLPDPYVYALQQDQQGFLWVATGKGLAKFDGQIFSSINTNFLGSDLIYASALQKNGDLWFGTSSGKLLYSKVKSNKLDSAKFNAKASITKILASEFNEEMYLNTLGNGIFIKKENTFIHVDGTENYQINDIALFSRDILLAATGEGFFAVNLRSQTISKINISEGGIKSIQKSKTEKNTFYLLTDKSIIYKLELNKKAENIQSVSIKSQKEIQSEVSYFFVREENQEIFTAQTDEHLSHSILNQTNSSVFNETDFLAAAHCFYEDSENNIWVATTGKGLYRLSKNAYDLMEENSAIFAVSGDSSSLYIGTKDGLITRDGRSITKIEGKELGKITSLYFDGKALWIGTENHGLFLVKDKSFENIPIEFSTIPNISINAITGSGNAVCVSTNLDGVYNYENYKLQDHFSVETTLLHNNVYYSLRTKTGKIFYATHNTSFSYSEGKQLYEIDTKDLGLIADFNSLAESKTGELFIATNGDGIYVMEEKTLHPFALNDELESKFCEGVVCDDADNTWIMQRYGLYKYYTNEKVLREIKFDNREQLMLNPNSFFKNTNGDLYFGTSKGLIHFSSVERKDKLALPYLVSLAAQDSLINNNEGQTNFSYGNYHISIEFSALGLKNSEDILFKYKLEGRDENWSELSKIRKTEFSKLGEGVYVFKVIAFNSEGFSSGEVALYSFSISAPYWKSSIFWIGIFILGCCLVFLIIRLRTAKLVREKQYLEAVVLEKTKELREEKEIVEKSNIRIEEQNHEIRDSITYAKRIQDALLPEKKILSDYQENIFVLYQPRDIVSGDFYWMAELGPLKFIVVADCTGHGVPGALMSMIGTTLLNKVVLEKKVTRPKDILIELDKEVKQALKQHTEDATRDGMDVCLCCVDTSNGKLIYAGAMRPLFFVRERQLLEYPATKHAIGGFSYGNKKEFDETEVELKIGDMFYLFSDGYADQFGGEQGKKLMLKNFKKILVSISEMDLVKQEENLKRVYNNWKGELDQVDDVLVIGVRI